MVTPSSVVPSRVPGVLTRASLPQCLRAATEDGCWPDRLVPVTFSTDLDVRSFVGAEGLEPPTFAL